MSITRTVITVGLTLAVIFGSLVVISGQWDGDPPAVLVESSSMMHCQVRTTYGDNCGLVDTGSGRFGTIDPGDVVLVRDRDDFRDVDTFAGDGKIRHGEPGDVVVYSTGATPIIHRAMFTVIVDNDGLFSVPELGLESQSNFNSAIFRDADYWGIHPDCRLDYHEGSLVPADSGLITKGDNNDCFDQGTIGSGQARIFDKPVTSEDLQGVARGELPWFGLLKLWVNDITGSDPGDPWRGGETFYDQAPTPLRRNMWIGVVLVLVGPYAYEKVRDRIKGKKEEPAPAAGPIWPTTNVEEAQEPADDESATADSSASNTEKKEEEV